MARGMKFGVPLPSGGILRVHGFIHRGAWMVGLFERGDVSLVLEREPDVVKAFEQDMLPVLVDFEFVA